MSLKDIWVDKVDDVDYVEAKDINNMAHSVIECEENINEIRDFGGSYPIKDGASIIQPDTYYVFGEVNSLSVTLNDPNDGRAHEYSFEFIPTEDFEGLTITPEPRWAGEPQFAAGKTCQVSILRGIGAMISA